MISLVLVCAVALLSSTLMGQDYPKAAKEAKDYYLQKSARQKKKGWILLGSGSAFILTGVIIMTRTQATFEEGIGGFTIGALGAVTALGSIPFFLVAENNKRRAFKIVGTFQIEKMLTPLAAANAPTISLSFRF